jgi:hypothetical protein
MGKRGKKQEKEIEVRFKVKNELAKKVIEECKKYGRKVSELGKDALIFYLRHHKDDE